MQEMQARSLGQEDPLEEETATHSSILAWEIPWTEEPGGLQSMVSQKSWTQLCCTHYAFYSFRSGLVLEKTLKSPLDCKEIKPVNPKGN